MIMPNGEIEGIQHIVRYIHSPALFIQRGNTNFGAKKRQRIFEMSRTD